MSQPQCPHCKYEFTDDDIYHTGTTEFPTLEDGQTFETHCSNCDKELSIQLDLAPSWIFLDKEGIEII